MNETIQKVENILQHVKKIESNCIKLGKKLIEQGEESLGVLLIVAGRKHDLSKLDDQFEFDHLVSTDEQFHCALHFHHKHNKHHPEYWPSIQNMPSLYVAEMVCDCVARAQEFGTGVREWFENEATVKYNFSMDDPIGKDIVGYLDLLLTPKFKKNMKTLVLENFAKQELEKEIIDLIEKDSRFANHEFWFHFHESYWPENRMETLKRLNDLQSGDNILCATVFDKFMQLEIMINILHEFIKKDKRINFFIMNPALVTNFNEFLAERESTLLEDDIKPRKKRKEKLEINKKFLECLEFHNIYRYDYLSEGPVLIKSKDLTKL